MHIIFAQSNLAPALWERIEQLTALAAAQGWSVYVVGGFVRDVLLKQPVGDLDLVVEGDAIACAQALATATSGSVRTHAAFGTATVSWADGTTLDVIQARREVYPAPAALPEVHPASLHEDLRRRDFTINTLAVALTPPGSGQLYADPHAQHDLEQGIVRALHDQSFVDDPTRVLRALRLATRLGFQIEPHTAALLHAALAQGRIQQTSPIRIRQELERCFAEPDPVAALAALAQWGVLAALTPPLPWDAQLEACMQRVLTALPPEQQPPALELLLLERLTPAARLEFAAHYAWSGHQRQRLAQYNRAEAELPRLRSDLTPGQLDAALSPFDPQILALASHGLPPASARMVEAYLTRLRPAISLLSGHDLRQRGLPPGPRYRRIIAAARAAQLDGEFHSPAEAQEWLKQYLEGASDDHD